MNRQEKIVRLQRLLERIQTRSHAHREPTHRQDVVGGRTPRVTAPEVQINAGLPLVQGHIEPIAVLTPPPAQAAEQPSPAPIPHFTPAEPVALPSEAVAARAPLEAPIGLTPAGAMPPTPAEPAPPPPDAERKPAAPSMDASMAEQPPASSRRPIVAPTLETAAGLELDLGVETAEPKGEVSVEQLGQTIELERATDQKLELATPEPPQLLEKLPQSSEMEAILPTSVSPGMISREVPPPTSGVFVLPEPVVEHDLSPDSELSALDEQEGATIQMEGAQLIAPPIVIEEPGSDRAFTLQTPPPSEVDRGTPAASVPMQPEPVEVRPVEAQIAALEIIPEPAGAEPAAEHPTSVTVRVQTTAIRGAITVSSDDAYSFVGAVRTFQPSSFAELLDASLSL